MIVITLIQNNTVYTLSVKNHCMLVKKCKMSVVNQKSTITLQQMLQHIIRLNPHKFGGV